MNKKIIKKWVVEQGEGHWEIRFGNIIVCCDDNELEETIEELVA